MSTFVPPIPSKLPFVVNQPSMMGDGSENFLQVGSLSFLIYCISPKAPKAKTDRIHQYSVDVYFE